MNSLDGYEHHTNNVINTSISKYLIFVYLPSLTSDAFLNKGFLLP